MRCVSVVLIAILSWVTSVFGVGCDITFSGPTNLYGNVIRYNGAQGLNVYAGGTSQMVQYRLKNEGDQSCFYFLTVSNGLYGTTSSERRAKHTESEHFLPYQIYKNYRLSSTQVLFDLSEQDFASRRHTKSARMNSGQVRMPTIYIAVPDGLDETLPAGHYQDTIRLRFFEGQIRQSDASAEPLVNNEGDAYLEFVLDIYLYPVINFDFVGDQGGNHLTLDFDAPVEDAMQEFSFHVKSNARYDVTFESQNGGHMVHNTYPRDDMKIRYDVERGTAVHRLYQTNPKVVRRNQSRAPQGKLETYRVKLISVPEVLFGGGYSDVITVEVEER